MSEIRKALLHSILNSYSLKVLAIASSVIVARLLTPSEVGTYAIASSLIVWLSEIKLMGANLYIIREKNIDTNKIRSSLGVSIILSWLIGFILFFSSTIIADFFANRDVGNIIKILAATFILSPYTSVYQALLTRKLKFNILLRINIASSIISITITILLILYGFSFYSLALGFLSREIIYFFGIRFNTHKGTPVIPNFHNSSKIIKLGLYSSTSGLLRKAQFTFPDLLIGRFGTTAQVGIFSKGLGFVEFVNEAVSSGTTPISLPYLSKNNQSPAAMELAYRKASVFSTALIWPVLAVVSVFAKPAIIVLFGNQWIEAAPLAAIIAISVIIKEAHLYSNQYIVASSKEHFLIIKDALIFLAFIISLVLYFRYSLIGLAYSYLLTSLFSLMITTLILKMATNFSAKIFIKSIIPSLNLTIICLIFSEILKRAIDHFSLNPYLTISIVALIMPIFWLSAATLTRHAISHEIKDIINKIMSKFKKQKDKN
ncbi:oligosaccharide flippase family protein [Mangrovitalea sediminis]|uniref:oligosaccharide flippase family protein n=1 Tax=Mangrovitalea sediminis TaxID=1982043 RepID=UPI000BE5A934|nr:oligosaccharide flippase family protein [Mangrovitalea sediminis]